MSQKKDYEVGYKKPPKHSQFKKGQSGNHKGKPSGAANKLSTENLYSLIEKEAFRNVKIREGERTLSMPMVKVIIRSLMSQAAKNNTRATSIVLEYLRILEERQLSQAQKKLKAKAGDIETMIDNMTDYQLDAFIKALEEFQKLQPEAS